LQLAREGKSLHRDEVYGEIYLHDCVELGKPKLSVTHRWIRHEEWKLIAPTKSGEKPELYHVSEDPHEKHDLAQSQPDRVNSLMKRLDQRWDPKIDGPSLIR
jgi:uncharacterized sulfatase